MNILITAMGSTTAISVAKAFDNEGRIFFNYDILKVDRNKVIGSDILPKNEVVGSKFCHVFYQVPPVEDYINYWIRIQEIINKEEIDVIIPCSDEEAEFFAGKKSIGCYVCAPKYKSSAIICNDKIKTFKFFKEIKIPTPETYEAKENYLKLPFPYIAKPRRGVGSKGFYVIKNLEDITLIERIEDPILQEKLLGREFTCDVLCDGKQMIACVPRWREETRDGKSWKASIFKNKKLTKL